METRNKVDLVSHSRWPKSKEYPVLFGWHRNCAAGSGGGKSDKGAFAVPSRKQNRKLAPFTPRCFYVDMDAPLRLSNLRLPLALRAFASLSVACAVIVSPLLAARGAPGLLKFLVGGKLVNPIHGFCDSHRGMKRGVLRAVSLSDQNRGGQHI